MAWTTEKSLAWGSRLAVGARLRLRSSHPRLHLPAESPQEKSHHEGAKSQIRPELRRTSMTLPRFVGVWMCSWVVLGGLLHPLGQSDQAGPP